MATSSVKNIFLAAHHQIKALENNSSQYQHSPLAHRSTSGSQGSAKRGRFNPMARPVPGRSYSQPKEQDTQSSLYSDDSNTGGATDLSLRIESNSVIRPSNPSSSHSDIATHTSYDIPSAVHLSHTQTTSNPSAQSSDSERDTDSVRVKVERDYERDKDADSVRVKVELDNEMDEDLEITGVDAGQMPQDTRLGKSHLDYSMSDSMLDASGMQLNYSKS